MDIDELVRISNIPLTDQDLEKTIGVKKEDIILYKDLANYHDIDELLPNDTDFKIILLEWERNKGHWVIIYKLKDKIFYFNSYGNKYDNDLNILTSCMKRILGEDTKQITRLLGSKKCEYSKKRFQKGNAQTCGRWCIMRVSMLKMGYTQAQFEKYMEDLKELYQIPYDLIVCKYITCGNAKPL
jgi:hypothetical protein